MHAAALPPQFRHYPHNKFPRDLRNCPHLGYTNIRKRNKIRRDLSIGEPRLVSSLLDTPDV
jgi:hypothetical protein